LQASYELRNNKVSPIEQQGGVWVIIAFGIVGFVLAGLSLKKIEFVQIRSLAGVRVLDIARSGPERHNFDRFVEALIQQIKNEKATTNGRGTALDCQS
jgi:hypothetical protein